MARSITFAIDGVVDTQVRITEIAGGKLRFDVEVLGGGSIGDLRGLFFDMEQLNVLPGELEVVGPLVTSSAFGEAAIQDLGMGVNVYGSVVMETGAFDAAIGFGEAGLQDDVRSASFVLSHATEDLTLDMVSETDFGIVYTSVGELDGKKRKDGDKTAAESISAPQNDKLTADENGSAAVNLLKNDGSTAPGTITGIGTSVPGTEILLEADGLALGSLSVEADGSATVLANSADIDKLAAGEERTFEFSYTASDAVNGFIHASTADFSVTIAGVNDAPVFGEADEPVPPPLTEPSIAPGWEDGPVLAAEDRTNGQFIEQHLAVLSNGNIVVSTFDYLVEEKRFEHFLTILDPDGARIAEIPVITSTANVSSPERHPASVLAKPDGGFTLVWREDVSANANSPDSIQIRMQNFDATGTALTEEAVAVGNGLFAATQEQLRDDPFYLGLDYEDVAMLSNGNIAMTLRTIQPDDGPYTNNYDIRVAIMSPNGVLLEMVVLEQGFNWTGQARLAATDSDGFMAIWNEASLDADGVAIRNGKAQLYDAAGVPQSGRVTLSDLVLGYHETIQLKGGGFVIARAGSGSAADFSIQVLNEDLSERTDKIVFATSFVNDTKIELFALSDGGFLASWLERLPDGRGVYIQRFDNSGNKVGEPFEAGQLSIDQQYGYPTPELHATVDGEVTLLWQGRRADGSGQDYYVRKIVYPLDGGNPASGESGVIKFTDPDRTDIHTASVTAASDAVGSVSATVIDDSTGDGQGNVSWAYARDASAYAALAEGESQTNSFEILLEDGNDGSDIYALDVTLIGGNDDPTLAAGAFAATEDGPAVTLDLAALGDDIDSDDDGSTLIYAVTGQPVEGAATISGTELSFDPGADFQDLAKGETREVTVEITATDVHGATAVNGVVVSVGGSNDSPIIEAGGPTVGDLDIVWGQISNLGNYTALNEGNGTFTQGSNLASQSRYRDVTLGDLDGDGDLDLFGSRGSSSNDILLNDGSGTFAGNGQINLAVGNNMANALGDLDGDGDLDAYVVRSSGSSSIVLLNDGNGTFAETGQGIAADTSTDVALGDLDGDGDLDAFVANLAGQGNKVFVNDGTAAFNDSGQSLGAGNDGAVELGDIDGDGDLDAVVAVVDYQDGAANRVYLNDGSGNFLDGGQALGQGNSQDVALADVDGDGDLDAIFANRGATGTANRLFLNDGNGVFTDSGQAIGSDHSNAVAFSDLDGDGDQDLVVGNVDPATLNGVGSAFNRIYFNDGNGAFVDSGQQIASVVTTAIAIGDIDGDGPAPFTGSVSEAVDASPGENSSTHQAGGVIGFSDADTTDTHTANFSPLSVGYLGTFSLGTPDTTSATPIGSTSWSFAVDDANLDGLALGQALIQCYDVTINDGNGGTATETVTVSIGGANDAPTIDAASVLAGTVDEDGEDASMVASGQMSAADVDTGALLDWSVAEGGLGLYGQLSVDATGEWTYQLFNDSAVVQSLTQSDSLTENLEVRVTDEQGADDIRVVGITVTGSDDGLGFGNTF